MNFIKSMVPKLNPAAAPPDAYALSHDPTATWKLISGEQIVRPVPLVSHDTPKSPGHLRFVCISDTHTLTGNMQLPPGDVLIHAGDFSNTGKMRDIEGFVEFLKDLDFQYKIVIAGNHDLTFDKASYPMTSVRFGHHPPQNCDEVRSKVIDCPGVTYLEDSMTEIQGIRIYGSPWQPWFCDWAFNLDRGKPCHDKWVQIPTETDILITHGPPLGHGDLCTSGERAGCFDLLKEIQHRIKPKYHIFGHIHEGYGVTTDGVTTFINPSTCNSSYRPIQRPIIFDFPIPTTN